MNKKLLSMVALTVLLGLSACAPADKDDITPPAENDVVEEDNDEIEEENNEEGNEESNTDTEKSEEELQEEFVRETFTEYDYTAPEYSTWEVKEEGPEKIAVIIKEKDGDKDKPKISKVIYLWNGSKEAAEVLHVEVENNTVYQGN